ncbi:MAG: hypothetical protein Q9204_005616 [Flavoplaca sp. TL-2023a]
MYPHTTTALLLTTLFHTLITTSPINYEPLLPSTLSTLSTPSPNDWEHFTYPLPRTPFTLKGRIFTSKPLNGTTLHSTLTGLLTYAQTETSALGPEACIPSQGIAYRIPGTGRKGGDDVGDASGYDVGVGGGVGKGAEEV